MNSSFPIEPSTLSSDSRLYHEDTQAVEKKIDEWRIHPGEVVLIGGGPGDPSLITVAGKRALDSADIILSDHLGPRDLVIEAQERGTVVIEVGKLPYGGFVPQSRINELLVDYARQGYRVARLKGGDPFVFGRGWEEVEACRYASIPVRVIPGLTSAIAAPGLMGTAITQRGINHDFSVVSGHLPPGDPRCLVNWSAVAQMRGRVALIMAVKNSALIAQELITQGKEAQTPVGIYESVSTEMERCAHTTLGEMAAGEWEGKIHSPAVILIGEEAPTTGS